MQVHSNQVSSREFRVLSRRLTRMKQCPSVLPFFKVINHRDSFRITINAARDLSADAIDLGFFGVEPVYGLPSTTVLFPTYKGVPMSHPGWQIADQISRIPPESVQRFFRMWLTTLKQHLTNLAHIFQRAFASPNRFWPSFHVGHLRGTFEYTRWNSGAQYSTVVTEGAVRVDYQLGMNFLRGYPSEVIHFVITRCSVYRLQNYIKDCLP